MRWMRSPRIWLWGSGLDAALAVSAWLVLPDSDITRLLVAGLIAMAVMGLVIGLRVRAAQQPPF